MNGIALTPAQIRIALVVIFALLVLTAAFAVLHPLHAHILNTAHSIIGDGKTNRSIIGD